MLNISKNTIDEFISDQDYKAFEIVTNPYKAKALARWLLVFVIIFIGVLFLPWTQYVEVAGNVTIRNPEQRPQTIQAVIPGRIQKWHVQEGELVDSGAIIVSLTEIKSEYFDKDLIARTRDQLKTKVASIEVYKQKVDALKAQRAALQQARDLKLNQTRTKVRQKVLKVQADSAKYEAAKVARKNVKLDYERTKSLVDQGIKSLRDLQEKESKLQEYDAKLRVAQNSWESTQADLLNTQVEVTSVQAQYADKLAKNLSDISSAESAMFDAQVTVSKLRVTLSNYETRGGNYLIRAPQKGYVTKAMETGVGQIVKEGSPVVTFIPYNHDVAAELYVDATDIPLIGRNHKVRLLFDGWPSVYVSGWPDASYGMFSGEIIAVDNVISANGKYRILVVPDNDELVGGPWPHALRMGAGVQGMALLNEVPVYREIWRKLNGFPQAFYDEYQPHTYIHEKQKKEKKKKDKKK